MDLYHGSQKLRDLCTAQADGVVPECWTEGTVVLSGSTDLTATLDLCSFHFLNAYYYFLNLKTLY